MCLTAVLSLACGIPNLPTYSQSKSRISRWQLTTTSLPNIEHLLEDQEQSILAPDLIKDLSVKGRQLLIVRLRLQKVELGVNLVGFVGFMAIIVGAFRNN